MENDKGKFIVKIDHDLEELIPGFFENRHSDIEELLEALQQNKYDEIKILGHTMKGAGGGYGFDEISEIGKEIEEAALEKNEETIRNLIKRLQVYLEKVQVVLE